MKLDETDFKFHCAPTQKKIDLVVPPFSSLKVKQVDSRWIQMRNLKGKKKQRPQKNQQTC